MSLKVFHIAFITLSSVLAIALGWWGFHEYRITGSGEDLALGLTGIGLFGFLIPYAKWFLEKMQRLPKTAVVIGWLTGTALLIPSSSQACAVCFGDPQSPLTQGAKSGVLFLVAVVGSLLAAIAGIAWGWARRAKHLP